MARPLPAAAAALLLTAFVSCTAIIYYRSWSRLQLAAGGWPPQQPLSLLHAPPPASTLEIARELYAYLETPTALCRRLQVIGGACSPTGGITGQTLICRDDAYAPQSGSCLVYSAGADWSAAAEAARHCCEVHVLNPSLTTPAPDGPAAKGVKFHRLGLAGGGKSQSGGPAATLSQIIKQLGHTGRVIDFLRVDVEGDEWTWLEEDTASLSEVRQLGMRVYLTLDSLKRYHRLLERLHAQGLRLVYTSPDSSTGRVWDVEGVDDKVAVVYDLVWINRKQCATSFGCAD